MLNRIGLKIETRGTSQNFKARTKNGSYFYPLISVSGPATLGGPGGMTLPLFCFEKKKKGNKGKQERLSKQKIN